jgi:hypothetical protein
MVVPPKPPQSHKLRTALIVVASLVIVALVAVLLANTADSGKKQQTATSNSAAGHPDNQVGLTLVIGPVFVQSAGPPAKLKPPVRRALVDAAQTYVDNAILAPLEHGKVNNAYEKVFDPGVKGAASSHDRAVLTEAATGAAKGPVHATSTRVRVDGIGDQNGKILLAAATFTMNVKTKTAAGPIVIKRHTELTFANEFGRWVVTAYRVTVRRSHGAKTTSASAQSSSSSGTTA